LIGVHVIGPGFGESVVIELPGGEVGVVDSFAPRHGQPPVLDFIRAEFPNLRVLKFVALTHPHADHCMGISSFLGQFDIEEFWVFSAFSQAECAAYFKALLKLGTQDRVERALDLPAGTVGLELLRIKEALRKLKGSVAKRRLEWERKFTICNGQVTVTFLTPGEAAIWRYSEALSKSTKTLLDEDATVDPEWDVGDLPHNDASGAILFEHGRTGILLMADAEENLWAEFVATYATVTLPKIQFIKASHHGSANGYHKEVYNWACSKESVLVLTPFNRHQQPLPTAAGVGLVSRHVGRTYCTNSVAASRSSRLSWISQGPGMPMALPIEWAVDCARNPVLLTLLAAHQKTHPHIFGYVDIPKKWAAACSRDPRLLQLLCAEVRNQRVSASRPFINDEFRVSVRYDEHGKVLSEYVGWGVGQI
jgi:hypothetical protein